MKKSKKTKAKPALKKAKPESVDPKENLNKLAEQEVAYESVVGVGNIIGSVVILKAIIPNVVNAGATGIP